VVQAFFSHTRDVEPTLQPQYSPSKESYSRLLLMLREDRGGRIDEGGNRREDRGVRIEEGG
jgi:hypothetical protein